MQRNDRGARGRGGLALDKDTQPPTMEDNGNQIYSKYRHKTAVKETPSPRRVGEPARAGIGPGGGPGSPGGTTPPPDALGRAARL